MATAIRVLLVDDDEAQYAFVRGLLETGLAQPYTVQWAATYKDGLRLVTAGALDVALVDYRLGSWSGLDLINEAIRVHHSEVPLIMLTDRGDQDVDMEAMQAGAADYLSKPDLTAQALDRALRYAVQQAQSLREYRSLFEASPVGLAHASLDGRWLRANRRLCEMLGYTERQLQGVSMLALVHPDDVPDALTANQALLRNEIERYDAEARERRADGSYMWARISVRLYRDASGAPRYFMTAMEDISGRKRADAELRRTVGQLQAVVASVPMSLWILDPQGIITFSEGRLLGTLGLQPGELVGRSQLELYPGAADLTRRALAGETIHTQATFEHRVFEMWYTPILTDGQFTGSIGIAMEITDRVRLEEQFRQAQKMEAIGRLAGGVAHDFNNLLTAIIGYGDLVLEELPPGSRARKDVEEMYKAGTSAAALTRQLLAFSRRQVLQPQVIDLNTTVARLESLLRRLIGEDVQLVTRLAAPVEPIFVDPSQIEQIVMNLAVNARDAMPAGGRLTLETRTVDLDAAHVARHPEAVVGPHVVLEVSDTGVGMDAHVRAQLFEPFFTTKERGKGTGLGLATVYGIVQQSGGFISVQSEPGRGATFSIYFPVAASDTVARDTEAPEAGALTGTETVLLVEDQDEVRAVARAMLRRSGYTVLEASRPQEAVDRCRANGRIDLLLTDVVLPEMGGRQLARVLRDLRPELRVIYTSGYTDDAIVHHGVLDAGVPFVQKPFTARSLLVKVREVLDAPPGTVV